MEKVYMCCSIVKKLPNLLFPLFWLDESAMINDKGMATFKQQFFNTGL